MTPISREDALLGLIADLYTQIGALTTELNRLRTLVAQPVKANDSDA